MPKRDGVPQVVASAFCRPGYGCAYAAAKVDFRSPAEAFIETESRRAEPTVSTASSVAPIVPHVETECPSAPKEAL
jgi:hypothetical protein